MSITKQVLVIRTKYPDGKGGFFKPRTGKLIAQGAHASLKVLLDLMSAWRDTDAVTRALTVESGSAIQDWLDGSFTKICVSVDSEEELLEIYEKAKKALVPCALIQDSGRTEFHGVPTKTVVAVGPAWSDEIDLITGGLPLL